MNAEGMLERREEKIKSKYDDHGDERGFFALYVFYSAICIDRESAAVEEQDNQISTYTFTSTSFLRRRSSSSVDPMTLMERKECLQ